MNELKEIKNLLTNIKNQVKNDEAVYNKKLADLENDYKENCNIIKQRKR